MKICYISGYWSRSTDRVLGARPHEYLHSYRYVWAVKHGSFKVPFDMIYSNGTRDQITPKNFEIVRRKFGGFIELRLSENAWTDALLVHVPSKTATLNNSTPRSLVMLQEAVASTNVKGAVCDALRWTESLEMAHEGGERRRKEILPFLKVTQRVQGRNVVLVDDLVTRGGSILASKDALEAAGANVVGAITCGRTMYSRDIKAYGNQCFDLDQELDDYGRLMR